jgi:hypothetical protein
MAERQFPLQVRAHLRLLIQAAQVFSVENRTPVAKAGLGPAALVPGFELIEPAVEPVGLEFGHGVIVKRTESAPVPEHIRERKLLRGRGGLKGSAITAQLIVGVTVAAVEKLPDQRFILQQLHLFTIIQLPSS